MSDQWAYSAALGTLEVQLVPGVDKGLYGRLVMVMGYEENIKTSERSKRNQGTKTYIWINKDGNNFHFKW